MSRAKPVLLMVEASIETAGDIKTHINAVDTQGIVVLNIRMLLIVCRLVRNVLLMLEIGASHKSIPINVKKKNM
ncbi:hypothetical protein MIDIC_10046 [Alphaproteobacteria bacterium]